MQTNLCLYLLEWWQCSWLKVVRMIKWCRMPGGGGDRRLSKKRGELNYFPFFCMSLHTSLYGVMTASLSCLNIRNLFIKWPTSKKLLTNSSAIWRPSFRVLSAVWDPQLTQQYESQELPGHQPSWNLGILLLELHGLWLDVLYFILLAGESLEVINCFQLKLLQQPFRAKVTRRLENGKNSNHCQHY